MCVLIDSTLKSVKSSIKISILLLIKQIISLWIKFIKQLNESATFTGNSRSQICQISFLNNYKCIRVFHNCWHQPDPCNQWNTSLNKQEQSDEKEEKNRRKSWCHRQWWMIEFEKYTSNKLSVITERLARNKYQNVLNFFISVRLKHICGIKRNVKRFKHKRHKR